jgi:uncharacterized 2Fe-2S/4Fe-4S cluster protein (DUF4445 family)
MSNELTINHEPVPVVEGATLFEMADAVEIRIPTSCQAKGKCRECLVEIEQGMELLSAPTEEEQHLQDNFRLSCRTQIVSPGTVSCHTLRRGEVKIVQESAGLPVTGLPIPLDPAVTRDGERILLDGEEIALSSGPIHGIAMDLGTTTVVLRLIDLESGEIVATQAFENPQRFGGSDVMARIKFDTDNKGRLLQRVLLGYLTHAIESFPVDPHSIYELIVAGNTTMRDLFFGLDVHGIGQKPYRSLTETTMEAGESDTTALSKTAKQLHLPIHPKARVLGLPLIGSHIGADTAACLLAVEMDKQDQLIVMMDIGTNTELVMGTKDKILAASCPAGPAFEGGELSCGMPGVDGAIERVRIHDDGSLDLEVIGNKPPVGLCGSGLIDLLGELVRTERVNRYGRYEDDEDAFYLDKEQGVYLLENDISLLAQAKGANVAGLYTVFEEFGVEFDEIDVFYFAGGFAHHINLDAAKQIGLIPNLPNDKIVQVGNASLEGATLALCSVERRETLERLVHDIRHVELETAPGFFDHFVAGCQYVPMENSSAAVLD